MPLFTGRYTCSSAGFLSWIISKTGRKNTCGFDEAIRSNGLVE